MVAKKTDIADAAHRFLKIGDIGGYSAEDIAVECDRLVRAETERSSRDAVRLGKRFVRLAESYGKSMRLTALRALGWAYLVAAEYQPAAEAYLAARSLAAKDPDARGRIDRALIDVYMYLGDQREAIRRAKMSMRVFRKPGREADLAKTEVNYANVLHRLDRHQEARELYHRAGAFFAGQGADLAVAFCEHNEANTLVQLFEFEEAERLYRHAKDIFERHDHDLRVVGCLYGLAWLHMLEGKFHVALFELAECEERYAKAGQKREQVLCLLDRAETYLGLNLCLDARDAARKAERMARKLGIRYEAAKAAFFLGKALLGLERKASGLKALRRAKAGFESDGNQAFLTAVQFNEVLALSDRRSRLESLNEFRRKMPPGQLPLWEALCDLELMSGETRAEEVAGRLQDNPAVQTVPHVRARYLTLLGDHKAQHGDSDGAVRHWRQAAGVLTAVRSQLPPTDIRAAFSEKHRGPYEKLIEATAETNPVAAATWHDRYRTAGIWSIQKGAINDPARDQVEESLESLAHRVTAMATQLGRTPGQRAGVTLRARSDRKLEDEIRTGLSRLEMGKPAYEGKVSEMARDIRTAAKDGPVLQLHCGRRDLIAFVHDHTGTRTHRFPNGVSELDALVRQWRFFVERAPYRDRSRIDRDLADETELLERIGGWLLEPLSLPLRKGRLLVAPDGSAASLPWPALPVNGVPMIEQVSIVLTPSIQHHSTALRQQNTSRHARVFVGATRGLTNYRREYEQLFDSKWHSAIRVVDSCRRENWPYDEEADIWHFTGHAQMRADNPFYSYLQLADGPMFAADFRLRRNTVNTVVLAACRTGLASLLPGEESTGFVRALLEMGARNVVASNWAVADNSTAFWMEEFYAELLSGANPPAAARKAAHVTRQVYPLAYDWAAFAVHGAG